MNRGHRRGLHTDVPLSSRSAPPDAEVGVFIAKIDAVATAPNVQRIGLDHGIEHGLQQLWQVRFVYF